MASHSTIVLFSDVDGTILDHDTYAEGGAWPGLRAAEAEGAPVILVSSKTAGELRVLSRSLGVRHPFIAENGAAIFVPEGYFAGCPPGAIRRGGEWMVELGEPRVRVVEALRAAARAAAVPVSGFADMTPREIAAETGLPLPAARLAADREWDEPFRVIAEDAEARRRLRHALSEAGVDVVSGGRYDHAMIGGDKGRAASRVAEWFKRAHGELVTVALGDALNDVPLLQWADEAFIVRSPSAARTQEVLQRVPTARVTVEIGPTGWATAVTGVLAAHRQSRTER